MTVKRRETSKGFTDVYHYRFAHKGKLYYGVCSNCTNKKQAEEFERQQRAIVEESTASNDHGVIPQVIKSLHLEITGRAPKKISLEEAFDKSLEKPKKRKATGNFLSSKKGYWRDFVVFMNTNFPEVRILSDVNNIHAEAYISYLRDNGRFCKRVNGNGLKKSYERKGQLSPKTINIFHDTIREVFTLLQKDIGIFENPFQNIEKLNNDSETREPFTETEMRKIFENADSFIYPIFAIGIATGLREGDICTLKWDEVDFESNNIRRKMRKTKNSVEIPMIPGLRQYLLTLRNKLTTKTEYVLTEHADMYEKNPSGVSYRVKQFLEKQGISTTRNVAGRSRRVSIKDCHSLRHTFAYIAGVFNIPLVIVQSILGHMTPEMTKHYQRHADYKAKSKALAAMPDFIATSNKAEISYSPNATRDEIERLLNSATEVQLQELLTFMRTVVSSPHLTSS